MHREPQEKKKQTECQFSMPKIPPQCSVCVCVFSRALLISKSICFNCPNCLVMYAIFHVLSVCKYIYVCVSVCENVSGQRESKAERSTSFGKCSPWWIGGCAI